MYHVKEVKRWAMSASYTNSNAKCALVHKKKRWTECVMLMVRQGRNNAIIILILYNVCGKWIFCVLILS